MSTKLSDLPTTDHRHRPSNDERFLHVDNPELKDGLYWAVRDNEWTLVRRFGRKWYWCCWLSGGESYDDYGAPVLRWNWVLIDPTGPMPILDEPWVIPFKWEPAP